jgi:hypothetical protein
MVFHIPLGSWAYWAHKTVTLVRRVVMHEKQKLPRARAGRCPLSAILSATRQSLLLLDDRRGVGGAARAGKGLTLANGGQSEFCQAGRASVVGSALLLAQSKEVFTWQPESSIAQ